MIRTPQIPVVGQSQGRHSTLPRMIANLAFMLVIVGGCNWLSVGVMMEMKLNELETTVVPVACTAYVAQPLTSVGQTAAVAPNASACSASTTTLRIPSGTSAADACEGAFYSLCDPCAYEGSASTTQVRATSIVRQYSVTFETGLGIPYADSLFHQYAFYAVGVATAIIAVSVFQGYWVSNADATSPFLVSLSYTILLLTGMLWSVLWFQHEQGGAYVGVTYRAAYDLEAELTPPGGVEPFKKSMQLRQPTPDLVHILFSRLLQPAAAVETCLGADGRCTARDDTIVCDCADLTECFASLSLKGAVYDVTIAAPPPEQGYQHAVWLTVAIASLYLSLRSMGCLGSYLWAFGGSSVGLSFQ